MSFDVIIIVINVVLNRSLIQAVDFLRIAFIFRSEECRLSFISKLIVTFVFEYLVLRCIKSAHVEECQHEAFAFSCV